MPPFISKSNQYFLSLKVAVSGVAFCLSVCLFVCLSTFLNDGIAKIPATNRQTDSHRQGPVQRSERRSSQRRTSQPRSKWADDQKGSRIKKQKIRAEGPVQRSEPRDQSFDPSRGTSPSIRAEGPVQRSEPSGDPAIDEPKVKRKKNPANQPGRQPLKGTSPTIRVERRSSHRRTRQRSQKCCEKNLNSEVPSNVDQTAAAAVEKI